MRQLIFKIFLYFSLYVLLFILYPPPVFAVVNPLSAPNNKFGIHIIQATPDESSPAASLVNSSGGDWGYITVLIEGKDKNQGKWQEFFNDLRRRHLIPLVRLATIPEGGTWKIPDIGEAVVWADFLNSLNWPTKNRYVMIYNEPNHAREWGNKVDAKSYAKVLDQTITALKSKNGDFFVLNGGLDASAPQQLPNYQDQLSFMSQMNDEIPGIFNKLDGWVSHSYPNPGFIGSPHALGRGSIRTWVWEFQVLKSLGVIKDLPVFIAETGWKHSDGMQTIPSFPSPDTVAEYFKVAFETAWSSPQIAAVTPFLLSYQDYPFDHFSFKKSSSGKQNDPPFHPHFYALMNLSKIKGAPIQENKALLTKGEVYSSIVAGETYNIALTFKNTGQSIWNDEGKVTLRAIEGGKELGIKDTEIPNNVKAEPNQDYTFSIQIKAPLSGKFKVSLTLFNGDRQFDSKPLEFETEVKSPVILKVKTALKWKKDYSGEYLLNISGPTQPSRMIFNLGEAGVSEDLEARHLLPDYSFDFTLEKPYYHPKTIHQVVSPGVNTLDFGTLQPNLLPALIHPAEFWKLLPWSK